MVGISGLIDDRPISGSDLEGDIFFLDGNGQISIKNFTQTKAGLAPSTGAANPTDVLSDTGWIPYPTPITPLVQIKGIGVTVTATTALTINPIPVTVNAWLKEYSVPLAVSVTASNTIVTLPSMPDIDCSNAMRGKKIHISKVGNWTGNLTIAAPSPTLLDAVDSSKTVNMTGWVGETLTFTYTWNGSTWLMTTLIDI